MNKNIRKILFNSFLIFFFIVTPILVFYTQGYRFDFEKKEIIQTGGLYFEIQPNQSSVYLNNKFVKKTDFLFHSILIENLLPKKHKVTIKKEDYVSWEKELEVKEKQVTEVSTITLFPRDFKFQSISKKVEKFWVSPQEEKIVWLEKEKEDWELKIYNLNNELQSHLLKEKDISRRNVDFINLNFSKDGKKIYLKVIAAEQLKNFSLNIDEGASSLKEERKSEINKKIIASTSLNNENYFLNDSGFLYKTKEDIRKEKITQKEKLNKKSFKVTKETPYQLHVFPDFVFLQEKNKTYKLNYKTKEFEFFGENIKNFKLSPDSKSIAYSSNGEIWIISLKKTKIYNQKEKVFLVRFSEQIKNLYWINPDYLVFNTENNIKITEIDIRDHLNIINIDSSQGTEIFWSPITKRLYLLKNKKLEHSKELIP